MFDLPVSKYSTYEIEADMNSYRIRHKMHDPRIIASILENHQEGDHILIPKVLHKYTGFKKISK